MEDKIYRDIRTNRTVRILKEGKNGIVAVVRLNNKQKYLTDKINLRELK